MQGKCKDISSVIAKQKAYECAPDKMKFRLFVFNEARPLIKNE